MGKTKKAYTVYKSFGTRFNCQSLRPDVDYKIEKYLNVDYKRDSMAYIEEISTKKKKYYYLAQTIRLENNTFKKIRVLLGEGNIPVETIQKLSASAQQQLQEKIKEIKRVETLVKLEPQIIAKLEQIKKGYIKLISSVSTIEYQVIERQQFIRFTFNTNAIEGSTITLQETAHLLEDGIAPAGKELREIHEIENTRQAYHFMKKYKGKVNSKFIKSIHYHLTHNILSENAGRFRTIQVYMGGSKHTPPRAWELSDKMNSMLVWMRNHKKENPVLLAAYIHHFFIAIHPFLDGNGRAGRLLLNFMLMKSGFPPICIKKEEKMKYIACLEQARDGNAGPLLLFIVEKIEKAYQELVDVVKKKVCA